MNERCIEAQGLSKVFPGGHQALSDFSSTIDRGERVAVVGANGAGKSTALRLLNLSYRPTSGAIVWDGVDTATLSAKALRRIRSRIGTVPQKYDLIPQMTVRANVLTGRLGQRSFVESVWSMAGDRDTAEVERALTVVGVAHLMEERCDRLSGGEQQRVAIARALYQQPEVLFADEPLAAVDPAGATKLMELLVEACASSGAALIMTSHQLHLLRGHFPRVIGLRAGKLFFDAKAEELTPRMLSALYGTDGELRRSSSAPLMSVSSPSSRALRIGVSSAGCEAISGLVLPELARANADVRLSVSTDHDRVLAEQLAAGELHLAFVLGGKETEEIGLIPVREEQIVLVSSARTNGAPLAKEELPALTLLWASRDHPVSRCLEPFALVPSIELGSITAVKAAVMNGLGAAFLPRSLAARELADGLLHEVNVAGLDARYPIYALRRQGHGSPELIDSAIELATVKR